MMGDRARRVRRRLVVLLLALCAPAAGDVLVTKSGSRWKGKVIEQGDAYVLVKPGGGRMTFPKALVKEVIVSKDMSGEFERMRRGADLCDDAAVAKLASFAAEHGPVDARKKLLADAYAARRAKAKGAAALRSLAAWCRRYSLAEQAAEAERQARQREYAQRLADAGKDGPALAKLAKWCEQNGLKAEAAQAEAAALRAAGDDEAVRKLLGYAKDPKTGKWTPSAGGVEQSPELLSFPSLAGGSSLRPVQAIALAQVGMKAPLAIWIESDDKKRALRTTSSLTPAQVRSLGPLLKRAASNHVNATGGVVWTSFYRVPIDAGTSCPPLIGALKQMHLSPPTNVSVSMNARNGIWLIFRCPGPMRYFRFKPKPDEPDKKPPDKKPPQKKPPDKPAAKSAFNVHTVYVSPVAPQGGRLRSVTKYTKIELSPDYYLYVFVTAPSAAAKENLFRCQIQTADAKTKGKLHASVDAAKFRPLRDTAGYEVHPALKVMKDRRALPRLMALFSGRAFKSKNDAVLIFRGPFKDSDAKGLRLVGKGIDLPLKP